MDNKLQEKLMGTIKGFTDEIGGIKEQCISDINSNMDKVEDVKMKSFLEDSLIGALKGDLSAKDFSEQFKNMTDGRG